MTDRIVFDCMVFLQALANPDGPAAACFATLKSHRLTLCTSRDTLAEIAEVLLRPSLARKFPGLTTTAVAAFLESVTRGSMSFSPESRISLTRDPKDAKYLDLAISASAAFLVSRDKDLLELERVDTHAASQLKALVPGLRIVDVSEFLREFPRPESRGTQP